MAEYYETEEIVKEYDSKLVRRILSYLKPYKLHAFAAFIALVISTLGELSLPVIVQKIIDTSIISQYIAIDETFFIAQGPQLSQEEKKLFSDIVSFKETIVIGNKKFVLKSKDIVIPAALEKRLRELSIIDSEPWYVFNGSPKAELQKVSISNGSYSAIPEKILKTYPSELIREVKRQDFNFLIRSGILFLIILILILLATFVQTFITTIIAQNIMKDIRLELFKKTIFQSTAFLSRNPVGRMVTRLTGDVETINEFFTSVLSAFLKDISVMSGVLITMIWLSPKLALITFLTLPPVAIVTAINRYKSRDAFRRQRLASSRLNSFLSERLSGVHIVQLFVKEKAVSDQFKTHNTELLKANLGEMYVYATFRPIIDFLTSLTIGVVLFFGGAYIIGLHLSLGTLIAFINLVQMFYFPVQDISEKYTILQSAMAGSERVFALMDKDEMITDKGKLTVSAQCKGKIEFKNVSFSYNGREPVLRHISFTVQPGEMVAIVGYTGAGKTTITNVLNRLWDIGEGTILLDDVPIEQYSLSSLRKAIVPVLQDVFLFSGTIADNIRLGLPISDKEVEDAAKAVYAHEFISKLPQGYQTRLSEGSTNISSGQRQLISFARLIAHNPRVIVLDEATSSIDTETELLIQKGLQKILTGRTSIVIAHRLSTIKHADRILVLSHGEIVESGTHDTLLKKNSLYAMLYRLQYENDETALF
ncbi:ABC transporter ATP-binding protein [Gracilinema caldarium]|uniref:ABC transporter ATP-binding protein n=1 Tax=Gracilinema caldarium TaxID=215591 RepID=UPI0026EF1E9A|nr:ABC transporter ATP-binding protein [Gracilinema caldarium]